MRAIIIAILSSLVLMGCGSTKIQKEVVTQNKTIVVTIPLALLAKCDVTEPIDRNRYIQLNSENKERELTNLIVKLYSDLSKCNLKISDIRNFQEKIINDNKDILK